MPTKCIGFRVSADVADRLAVAAGDQGVSVFMRTLLERVLTEPTSFAKPPSSPVKPTSSAPTGYQPGSSLLEGLGSPQLQGHK